MTPSAQTSLALRLLLGTIRLADPVEKRLLLERIKQAVGRVAN
jgi:hypothetical protein